MKHQNNISLPNFYNAWKYESFFHYLLMQSDTLCHAMEEINEARKKLTVALSTRTQPNWCASRAADVTMGTPHKCRLYLYCHCISHSVPDASLFTELPKRTRSVKTAIFTMARLNPRERMYNSRYRTLHHAEHKLGTNVTIAASLPSLFPFSWKETACHHTAKTGKS